MSCIDIADIKKHLNIDFDNDDAYLQELIDAAQEVIERYINRPLTELQREDGTLNPSVRHAVRLLVGAWYANREPVTYGSASNVPYTLDYILLPLKRFITPSEG